jgi:hypothetical protein
MGKGLIVVGTQPVAKLVEKHMNKVNMQSRISAWDKQLTTFGK